MMKAIQMSKADDTRLVVNLLDLPRPRPGPEELLVCVKAASIAPSDLLNSHGSFGETTFPRILGRDFAGVVVEGPTRWLGIEVFGTSGNLLSFTQDGTHAEYLVVHVSSVVVKPQGLSFAQAAAMGIPWTTAHLILDNLRVTEEDIVLVLGAHGAVGDAAVQLSTAKGCRVITAGRSGNLDVNTTADPHLTTAVAKAGGTGPSAVIDTVGSIDLLRSSLAILAPKGRYALMSVSLSSTSDSSLDLRQIYRKEHQIVGCNSVLQSPEDMTKRLEHVSTLFKGGMLTASPNERYKLIRLEEALDIYRGLLKLEGRTVIVF